jgi:hypothetical protein
MNTEPILADGQPYIPVIYLAEALDATVASESMGGDLVVTITSATVQAGDFYVPRSYTDTVIIYDSDYAKGTGFQLAQGQSRRSGNTSFQNRKELLLVILAQQISSDAIDRISYFIDSTNELPRSSERLMEEFIDIESNRLINMERMISGGYLFLVNDDGFIPMEYIPDEFTTEGA